MSSHSELSPSDSGRWTRCPGSIRLTRDHRDDRSSLFAAEGTVAHIVREQSLIWGFDAYDFIGREFEADGHKFVVDDEMANNLQPGIDEIREFEGKLFIEQRVDTTPWLGRDSKGRPQSGNLDAGIAGRKLNVISDLKYGEGVAVQAVKNTQQIIYALSFWKQFARHVTDATEFLIIIDQPRNSAGGGRWRVGLSELQDIGNELKAAAERTRDPNAPLIPTELGCQWCLMANMPGRVGGCPAHNKWLADLIEADFGALEALDTIGMSWEPPEGMSREARSHLVRVRTTITKWLERLHADELHELINYGPAFGFKAVEGRHGHRKHRDNDKSCAWMRARGLTDDQLFTKKLISPSQGEKILHLQTGRFPKSLVERGAPKPVIVPVEDERPAITMIEDEFDDQL